MGLDETLFNDKTFSNVLEDIYKSTKKREKQIDGIVDEIKGLIESIGDATIIVPTLKDLLDVGVKNTDVLVKMLNAAQKMTVAQQKGDTEGFGFAAEELQSLLGNLDEISDDLESALPPGQSK